MWLPVLYIYIWLFTLLFFLFRPFQLKGVKLKLILVCSIFYSFDSLYRVALQALGISHSHISYPQKIPLNVLFLANQCLQVYLITNHLCIRSKQKLTLFFQMIVPGCFCFLTFFIVASSIYPAYNKQENRDGRLLIALFSPLIGVVLKVISRICVQRTPRRERLMADIVIMSMLFESTAIMAVNSYLYLYQFIYLENSSLLELLQPFAIHVSVQLGIEWFFTSISLAIVTRYQNMAAMAVWRRRWKRHILVAIVNAVPMAFWTSTNLLTIVHGRFDGVSNKPCKMPFT